MANGITRRALLFLAAAVAAFPLWRYLRPPHAGLGGIEVAIQDLPENGVYMLRDRKLAVIRRNGEISAISIACTHLGCTLNVVDDAFVCPCHGSVFTLDGRVTKGPATVNLWTISHSLDAEKVIIHV